MYSSLYWTLEQPELFSTSEHQFNQMLFWSFFSFLHAVDFISIHSILHKSPNKKIHMGDCMATSVFRVWARQGDSKDLGNCRQYSHEQSVCDEGERHLVRRYWLSNCVSIAEFPTYPDKCFRCYLRKYYKVERCTKHLSSRSP